LTKEVKGLGKIIGNYEVIKQIGEGGFARTYLAKHRILGESACLKQNIELSTEDKKLLIEEAKLLWHIHHYSLPTLRDFIECPDGSFVLVMTFIHGKDLFKIVNEDYSHGIEPEHVAWMIQRLLNALHYLHFHGVIHGDVKPQNILIQPVEHNAVLVDYGLSSIRPTRASTTVGYTPAFAAPEQLKGKPALPQTDLYGLGASMVFALGGNHLSVTYPSGVPKKLQDFLNKLLIHDPIKRPNQADALVKELSDLRQDLFGRRSLDRDLKIT
jgi:serine/threonine-protein kinase